MSDSTDTENTGLMDAAGDHAQKRRKHAPDWERFGLSQEPVKADYKATFDATVDSGYQHTDPDKRNELFHEDQNLSQKVWWKSNFFIREPVLFGTWDGVFTSCLINLLGVVIFLRLGWIVGNAGVGLTILTIILAVTIVLIVALSGIGVCERCHMESGGVYFLMSHVLGARIGGSVGVIYCFAQAVSCSLSVMGFGESILGLTGLDNPWIAKGVAIGLVVLLLGINIAGVKWVIRLQLLLLMVLFLSAMDFLVGSFVHIDWEHGVTGYRELNFRNNSGPSFLPGESFFSMFGLFFSTVTGILAGINMSGDLREPFTNIPRGTLAALSVSTFLYISFTLVLGATCVRINLQTDYMIAEKVSVVGVLWLTGLYISSVSACMGSLYGPPRVLQTIANENVIPIIRVLGHGRGPNKVPIYSLVLITFVVLLFVLVGDVNTLAPIVTTAFMMCYTAINYAGPNKVPIYSLVLITFVVLLFVLVGDVNTLAPIVTTAFMMCYTAINYAYFALAMSYDKRHERDLKFGPKDFGPKDPSFQKSKEMSNGLLGYGTTGKVDVRNKDSLQKLSTDLDKLFPERLTHRGHRHLVKQEGPGTPTTPEADFDATKRSKSLDDVGDHSDASQVLLGKDEDPVDPRRQPNMEITKQPRSWYSFFCNRWLSLFGSVISLVIMFGTQWAYALGELVAAFVIYIYIGQANPGYFPGIAEFNFYEWIKQGIRRCCRGHGAHEEIIVAPNTPAVTTLAAQLTEDNEDFASRGRYHQSEIVQGDNFDDYESDS